MSLLLLFKTDESGGGVSGAAAQTLGVPSQVATATLGIAGSASRTITLSQAASGVTAVTGSVTSQIAVPTQVAAGRGSVTCIGSQLLAIGSQATGSPKASGAGASAIGVPTQAAAGVTAVTGVAANLLGLSAQAASGVLVVFGSGGQVIAVTGAGSGYGSTISTWTPRIRRVNPRRRPNR